ncbi:MAG: hypothetical protein ACXVXP_04030 [Mycobacteriaceae bacterium]
MALPSTEQVRRVTPAASQQLLGDVGRGNCDPKLTVFGENVTPNMHALVSRFSLMDNVLANSEASIQGIAGPPRPSS